MFCGYVNGSPFSVPCANTNLGCDNRCWQHCPTGISCDTEMKALHDTGLSPSQMSAQYLRIMEGLMRHAEEFHGENCPALHITEHSGNGKHLGEWAFTLTKSPNDDLSEEDMIKAVRKIMNQKSCPVKKFAWYLEYKENKTHPHIHGMYETESGGRIEAKHFKRAWPIWDEKCKLGKGFRGGYHRPVNSSEGYGDYISKDGGMSESYGI